MNQDIVSELAPNGTLRVGINLGNILLVTGATPDGDPVGVAPDMGREIADRLGVDVIYETYATPGEVADAGDRNEWDIALIAAEPKRAESITFSTAYVEIEGTYLVPAGSPIQEIDDVDREGVRIAVSNRAAYDLYLTRTLKHAELVRAEGLPGAVELFVTEKLDALAGLRPALNENAESIPGARILDGRYTTIQQAIGTRPKNTNAAAFLQAFVTEVTGNGFVAGLLQKHGVQDKLQVASGE